VYYFDQVALGVHHGIDRLVCTGRLVDHLGIQVDSPETVMAHLARVKAAGLPVREEIGVNCCHANQDKFWVHDPDGVKWEVYHLNYDLEPETEAPAARSTGLPIAQSSSCCAPKPAGAKN